MISCDEDYYRAPNPYPTRYPAEPFTPFQAPDFSGKFRIDWLSAVDRRGRHWPNLLRPGFEMPPERLHPDFVPA